MTMARWDPFGEAQSLRQVMDRLIEDALVPQLWSGSREGQGTAGMPLDVLEHEDAIEVRASLPGLRPEDVDITVQDNVLTIEGERREARGQPAGDQTTARQPNGQPGQPAGSQGTQQQQQPRYHYREHRYGRVFRQLVLPAPIKADQAQATFEHGILTLRLPKAEEARPRRIPITGGSQAQQLPAGQGKQTATSSARSA